MISIRFTPEEIEAVEAQAEGQTLSGYLRNLALAEVPCETCDRQPPTGFICSECGRANTTRKESE